MTGSHSAKFKKHSDDDPLAEQILAELERKAELGTISSFNACDPEIEKEHHRCFSLIERLALPIRASIHGESVPPCLPEYGALEEIGRGGMGIVYRAQHHKTQRIDAIKIIRPDRLICDSPADVHQLRYGFQRESRLASRVSHEHIVAVYQVGEVDEFLWFSMQYVDGFSLHELLNQNTFTLERGVTIVERISRAVDVVHKHGVLHGDIKPQNILIEHETNRPLMTDFGLAELAHGVNAICTGVAGTFAYMAPELVVASQENYSPEKIAAIRSVSSDIYSLGATLCAVLHACASENKQSDFDAIRSSAQSQPSPTTSANPERIPAELARICRKCMSAEPASRYATASDFADDLSLWLERPTWNRYFPDLGKLLWMFVAPGLGLSGLAVWLLLQRSVPEAVIWIAIFIGYFPLFAAFLLAQTLGRESHRARRELWSIWLGHLVGSVVCMIALRVLSSDINMAVTLFYPCCAAISAVVFFAKSGNFWRVYRPIGALWTISAIVLSLLPAYNAVIFGGLAALTCVLVARGDEAFDKPRPTRTLGQIRETR